MLIEYNVLRNIWHKNSKLFIIFYSNLTQRTRDHKIHTNSKPFKKHNIKPTIYILSELALMSEDLLQFFTQLYSTFWKLECECNNHSSYSLDRMHWQKMHTDWYVPEGDVITDRRGPWSIYFLLGTNAHFYTLHSPWSID
jgi:hypothetical protein